MPRLSGRTSAAHTVELINKSCITISAVCSARMRDPDEERTSFSRSAVPLVSSNRLCLSTDKKPAKQLLSRSQLEPICCTVFLLFCCIQRISSASRNSPALFNYLPPTDECGEDYCDLRRVYSRARRANIGAAVADVHLLGM